MALTISLPRPRRRGDALLRSMFAVSLIALVGTAATSATSASAAPVPTITVTSTADDGSAGTFRAALIQANTDPGADVIALDVTGTVTLTSDLPQLTESVTVTGPGAASLTLNGGGYRMFRLDNWAPTPLVVTGVTLTGAAGGQGGLLFNIRGTATFDDVVITGVSGGPAMFTKEGGVTTITDSEVHHNGGSLIGADHGGGPGAFTADDTQYANRTYVTNSNVHDNGWCVIDTERFVAISGSSFTDNVGSAVCARGSNPKRITSSVFARNGGDALSVGGSGAPHAITLDNVRIYENAGSGITTNYIAYDGSNWVGLRVSNLAITDSFIFGNGVDLGNRVDAGHLVNTVVGIPTPPRSATATARTESVDVSWVAPVSNSGSAITGYTVTADPGDETCTTSTTDCTVEGLAADTAYTFTVTATNGNGVSWASTATASITPVATTTTAPATTTTSTTTAPQTTTTSNSTSTTTAPSTTTTTAPTSTTSSTSTTAAPTTTIVSPTSAPGPLGTSSSTTTASPLTVVAPSTTSTTTPTPVAGAVPIVAELVALSQGLDAPTTAAPGDAITVSAPGFLPGERVSVIMRSDPVTLGEVIAGPDGRATAAVRIPTDAPTGDHHLYLFGLSSRAGAQAPLTVTDERQLAFTGSSNSAGLATSALALLVTGALLLRNRRPRVAR